MLIAKTNLNFLATSILCFARLLLIWNSLIICCLVELNILWAGIRHQCGSICLFKCLKLWFLDWLC